MKRTDLSQILRLLEVSEERAATAINLVPSEAKMSPTARLPLNTDLYFRYFFNEQLSPDFWEFRGGEIMGGLEHEMTIPSLQRLGKSKFVNIRPLSGLSAMLLLVSAMGGDQGSSVVCIDGDSGGHFATENVIRRLGRTPLPLDFCGRQADLEQLADYLEGNAVSLLYLDCQNFLLKPDISSIVQCVADVSPTTWVHVDCSHTLGLVLGGVHRNPLDDGAGSFGGSTHKTFPGPQKGVLFTNSERCADSLRQAQFDLVSSHHFAETLCLGIAAIEFEQFGHEYAKKVVSNAQLLAKSLASSGFAVVKACEEYTETHQVWFPYGDPNQVNELASVLAQVGILANTQQRLPGLPSPVFRLGTNEVTFEGAGSQTMTMLADAFAAARDGEHAVELSAIRQTFDDPYYWGPDTQIP